MNTFFFSESLAVYACISGYMLIINLVIFMFSISMHLIFRAPYKFFNFQCVLKFVYFIKIHMYLLNEETVRRDNVWCSVTNPLVTSRENQQPCHKVSYYCNFILVITFMIWYLIWSLGINNLDISDSIHFCLFERAVVGYISRQF